jgi:hypothetical protein
MRVSIRIEIDLDIEPYNDDGSMVRDLLDNLAQEVLVRGHAGPLQINDEEGNYLGTSDIRIIKK